MKKEKGKMKGYKKAEKGDQDSRGQKVKKSLGAALTLELSLLLPLIFFVIFGLLYYDFLTQNRMSAFCAAAEQAVSGKSYEDILTVGGEEVSYDFEENASTRKVVFSSSLRAAYGKLFQVWQEEAVYRRLYPVDFIWQLKAAKELGENQ